MSEKLCNPLGAETYQGKTRIPAVSCSPDWQKQTKALRSKETEANVAAILEIQQKLTIAYLPPTLPLPPS